MFKKLKIVIIATGISCCVVSLYAGINSITLSNWKALSKQTHIVAGNPGQLQFQFTLDYKDKYKYPVVYRRFTSPRKIIDDSINFEVYTDSDRPLPKTALTLGFSIRGKRHIFTVPVKSREWVKVSIPLHSIHDKKYRRIYFQIRDSQYKKSGFKHGSKVKFKIKRLRFAGFEPQKISLDSLLDSSSEIIYSDPERTKVIFDSRVTHDSKQSFRIDVNKSLGDLDFKGTYERPRGTYIWIKLPENNIEFSNFTTLSYYVKLKGARHAYIVLGFSNKLKEKPLYGIHTPIDSGDWRRYTFAFGYIKKMPAPKFLVINIRVQGHNVDEESEQSIYIDDLQLSNIPLRHSRGWSIDPTIIAVNQAGFNTYKEKLAVVNSRFIKQPFKVVDSNDGKTYFSGVVESKDGLIGTTGIINFTNLTRPGNYKIVSGSIKSASFDVGAKAYDKCISLVSDWVANMRCGCKTDLHVSCHMDDGYLPTLDKGGNIIDRKHYDFSGGWHDAGDVRTYYSYSARMGTWMLPAYQAGWNRDRNTDGVEDFYDSALWAMKHLIKIRNPRDGRFLIKAADRSFRKNAKMDHSFGNYWTDNISNNNDDRYVTPPNKWGVSFASWAIESIARFAEVAKPKDKLLAEKLLAIAEERWDYWFHPETGRLFTADYPVYQAWEGKFEGHYIRNLGWYGSASLALYKATGQKNKKYYDFAMKCADKILETQNRTFSEQGDLTGDVYINRANEMTRVFKLQSQNKYACENFITECMKELPENDRYYKWRSFLVISADWWMKSTRSKWAPFSLPHGEVKTEYMGKRDFGFHANKNKRTRYQYIVPHAGARTIGPDAYHMRNVAEAINDIELENLAMRQLQWMIGFNPFGVSFVCEFGEDYIDQFYSFAQGIMPGQIGTNAGTGKYTGVKEKGIPGVIRPKGSESWTIAGARYVSALATLSRPARVKLKIMSDNIPYKGKVKIIWPTTQKVVFKGKTDNKGNLPIANLDGGQLYTIKVGKTTIPLKAVSGTKISKTINLNNLINIAVITPNIVKAGKTFKAILSVTNTGRASVNTEILYFGDSAKSDQQSKKIKLAVGETKKVDWTFIASSKPGPYVISFKENRKRGQIVDVSGKINNFGG